MYRPGNLFAVDPEVVREFDSIARELVSPADLLRLKVSYAAPVRLGEGVPIAFADGTNWNPGAGAGVYAYYGGAWNKLG